MKAKLKLWIEKDDKLVLSAWRVELLEAVAATGSLSEAANQLGIHFRSAWGRVRQMEERFGFKLLKTQVGGVGGGGATLTPAAEELVKAYHELSAELEEEVERRFQAVASRFGLDQR